MPRQTSLTKSASADQSALLTEWETGAKSYFGKGRSLITGTSQLPPELPLAAGVYLFLETLKGQSQETAKTYRVGCRRFMWFIFETAGQIPDQATIYELSPLVLEDFYLWLVATYGRKARATCNSYMAAARNLFDYLARRRLTPGGCQFQEMVAGLSRLQGRASYKTPVSKVDRWLRRPGWPLNRRYRSWKTSLPPNLKRTQTRPLSTRKEQYPPRTVSPFLILAPAENFPGISKTSQPTSWIPPRR